MLDTEKVIDEFESKKGRSKFFFWPIYFEFCEKTGYYWILRLPKWILAFASNKKFFVPIVKCSLSAFLMTFKSFALVTPQPQYSKSDNEISIWFIYCFVSSLIFGPYIFLFGFPRHKNFTLHKKQNFPTYFSSKEFSKDFSM